MADRIGDWKVLATLSLASLGLQAPPDGQASTP